MKTLQVAAGAFALAVWLRSLAVAEPGPASTVPDIEDDDYVVFVGLAAQVDVEGRLGELREVGKDGARIVVDDRQVVVPSRRVRFANTRHAPKVATLEMKVEPIKSYTWITPTLDPRLQAMSDANRLMAETADQAAISQSRLLTVQEGNVKIQDRIDAGDELVSENDLQNEKPFDMEYQQSAALLEKSFLLDDASGLGADADVPADRYTTTFNLSCSQELSDLYAIGLLVIRTVGEPDKPMYTLRLQRLPSVGPKPKRVAVEFFGLPMGFAVDRFELHVFSGGVEVATSESRGRVTVTRSEAYDLLLVQYLVDHKDDRRPPEIVQELLRSEPALTADQAGRFAKVKVNRDGRVTSVALAAVGDRSKDAQLEAFVKETLFYPALVDGDQVDGEVEITLGELAL